MAHLGPSLRRQKRTERPLRRAAAAVVAALAPNSSAQWDATRAVAGSQRPAAPSPPAPEERPAGRVVELSPDQKASSEPPPNAKFLSDRNTRVDKETVSRHADNHPRVT